MNLDNGTYGLIGPNSAGKTTFMRKFAASHEHTVLARTGSEAVFAGNTVESHIQTAKIGRLGLDLEIVNHLLEEADIHRKMSLRSLSHGSRSLLSVACALAAPAETTLLDEPFTGLDTANRNRVRNLIIEMLGQRDNWTLMISSHYPEDLVGIVDHLITVVDKEISEPFSLETARLHRPVISGEEEPTHAIAEGIPVLESNVLGRKSRLLLSQPLSSSAQTRAAATDVKVEYLDEAELINTIALYGPPTIRNGQSAS